MNHGKIKKTTSKNQIERPQMRGVLFVGRVDGWTDGPQVLRRLTG